MAISPVNVSNINLSNVIKKAAQAEDKQDSFISFGEVLDSALTQAKAAEQATKQDIIKVASGQADDLHTIMINSAKADLAIQTIVQVRNKALEAYNEIMRITL